MFQDMQILQRAFTYFLAMMFCLTFHEAAHALVAKWQGDPTAEDEGRLSLNPLVHMDMLGTVVLPLIGALASMPVIGWAKPVPVNPRNFRSSLGNVYVAAAGPVANLLFCIVCVAVLMIVKISQFAPMSPGNVLYPLTELLMAMVGVNAILAVFNLIPLPPLDGAAILEVVLPTRWVRVYEERIAPYGIMILFLLAFTGGLFWVSSVANIYISLVSSMIGHLAAIFTS